MALDFLASSVILWVRNCLLWGHAYASIMKMFLWLLLLLLKGKEFLDQFLCEFPGSGHLPHAGSMRTPPIPLYHSH